VNAGIWQTMNRCCPCRRRGQASGRSLTSQHSTYAAARHREVLKWQLGEMSRKVFCSCNTALNNFALRSVIHYGYSDCDKLFGSDLGANCHRTLTATSAVNLAKFCVSNFHSAVFTSILGRSKKCCLRFLCSVTFGCIFLLCRASDVGAQTPPPPSSPQEPRGSQSGDRPDR
jgi:hypothetical protein